MCTRASSSNDGELDVLLEHGRLGSGSSGHFGGDDSFTRWAIRSADYVASVGKETMEYAIAVLGIANSAALIWIWHDFKSLKSNLRRGQEFVAAHNADGHARCDFCDHIVARHRTRGGKTACANCYHLQGLN